MDLPLDEIICGDNCDVLGTLPRDCIDLVVTSPPYDDLRTYGGHEWDFYGVAWQLKRVVKPGGVVVWVVNDQTKDGSETGSSWRQAHHFQALGMRIHDTMIYQKNGMTFPDSNRYLPCWEYCFIFSAGKPATFNGIRDRKNLSPGAVYTNTRRERDGQLRQKTTIPAPVYGLRWNVWIMNCGGADLGHPAIFPESLARDHILSWSNPGDIVLDPFNGSGTTTKMARETERRYIGIEINPDYCEIAKSRLSQQLLPFGNTT